MIIISNYKILKKVNLLQRNNQIKMNKIVKFELLLTKIRVIMVAIPIYNKIFLNR
jgi:hypothetical protein